MQAMADGTPQGNIILYQTEDGQSRIDVTLSGDTVWLTADQMAELFQRNKSTISRHIRNVFESGELNPDSTVAFFATVQNEGSRTKKPMYMKDWIQKLDEFLSLSGKELLTHAGTVSAEIAKQKADSEYDKYSKRIQYELSPVEIHFIESFEKEVKRLKK